MTFKKLILILSIVVISMVVMLLSTSYAWYTYSTAKTTFQNVETFNENLSVVFANTSNISTIVGVPITSAQVESYSNKTLFTVTPSSIGLSGKSVAFQIDIVDINIDSELTEDDTLKYSLLQTINGTTTTITSGDFEDFADDSINLLSATNLGTASYPYDTTYYYEFRLWLQENNSDQNDLMGKSITGQIAVSTALK